MKSRTETSGKFVGKEAKLRTKGRGGGVKSWTITRNMSA